MNRLKLITTVLAVIFLSGCAILDKITLSSSQDESVSIFGALPSYSGAKARLGVADFELRTPGGSSDVCLGLREMIIGVLNQSKRFIIIDRKLLVENSDQGSSLSKTKPSASVSREKHLGVVVTVAVAEFEPAASGGRVGVGGGGGASSGIFGGLLSEDLNKARISLDVRITDASTSKVIAARTIQSQASDISGNLVTGSSGVWALDKNLLIYANTPMEKALRICSLEAVRYISGAIPGRYYRY